ncbi:MAG: hypothetical protein ABIV47_08010 [Roseiflexaceae bacterium]
MQDRLWRLCIASTRPRLGVLAQRLDARATWKQSGLPDERLGCCGRSPTRPEYAEH